MFIQSICNFKSLIDFIHKYKIGGWYSIKTDSNLIVDSL